MVRAFAGDSTITRFFGTAGSVAPGPARPVDSPLATPSSAFRGPPAGPGAEERPLNVADAAKEVLVELDIGIGLHGRGSRNSRRGGVRGCGL